MKNMPNPDFGVVFISAAHFLMSFIGYIPWVHIDISGMV